MTGNRPLFGAGLGFRREFLSDLAEVKAPPIDFFEIAPENWLQAGGAYQEQLQEYTHRFPFVCHGLSLSIGSADPLDIELVKQIKLFLREHKISLYTEHLSWCSYNGHLYDLLPVPFNKESIDWIVERVKIVQDILEQPISLENASFYLTPPGSTMPETDFINQIIHRSGCGLHLDVNNIYVNSQNFKFDPVDYLKQLPLDKVTYVHVAGHFIEDDGFIVDTHGADVIDPVWDLLLNAYTFIGCDPTKLPTCLERDFNFPQITTLFNEVEKIRRLQQEAQKTLDVSSSSTCLNGSSS